MKGFQSSKYPFVMYADRARKHLHGSSLTGKVEFMCGKTPVPVQKRWESAKRRQSGLILMASIEMQLRVTLAAAFKRPSRVSKSGLHGNYSCTISISLCQLHSLRWSGERKKAIKSGQNSRTRPKRIPTKSRKKMFRCSNNPWTKDETKKSNKLSYSNFQSWDVSRWIRF